MPVIDDIQDLIPIALGRYSFSQRSKGKGLFARNGKLALVAVNYNFPGAAAKVVVFQSANGGASWNQAAEFDGLNNWAWDIYGGYANGGGNGAAIVSSCEWNGTIHIVYAKHQGAWDSPSEITVMYATYNIDTGAASGPIDTGIKAAYRMQPGYGGLLDDADGQYYYNGGVYIENDFQTAPLTIAFDPIGNVPVLFVHGLINVGQGTVTSLYSNWGLIVADTGLGPSYGLSAATGAYFVSGTSLAKVAGGVLTVTTSAIPQTLSHGGEGIFSTQWLEFYGNDWQDNGPGVHPGIPNAQALTNGSSSTQSFIVPYTYEIPGCPGPHWAYIRPIGTPGSYFGWGSDVGSGAEPNLMGGISHTVYTDSGNQFGTTRRLRNRPTPGFGVVNNYTGRMHAIWFVNEYASNNTTYVGYDLVGATWDGSWQTTAYVLRQWTLAGVVTNPYDTGTNGFTAGGLYAEMIDAETVGIAFQSFEKYRNTSNTHPIQAVPQDNQQLAAGLYFMRWQPPDEGEPLIPPIVPIGGTGKGNAIWLG